MRLVGTLRRARDGAPVPGVELALTEAGGEPVVVATDAGGAFGTEPAFGPGLVRAQLVARLPLEAPPAGRRFERGAFLVPESASSSGVHALDLRLLEPDASLRVRLVRDGAPAAGGLRWSGPLGGAKRETDASGLVELAFAGLESGDRVRLHAKADRFHAERELVFPWASDLVELELVARGFVRVRVVGSDGRPQAGRCVTAGEEDRGFTGASGQVTLWLPLGPTRVSLRDEPAVEQWIDVKLSRGDTEVELVSAARLVAAGRVVAEDGEPLEHVAVSASAPGWFADAVTGEDGRFELHAPPSALPATLRLRAAGGITEEAFEPAELAVPVGSTDVLFRRAAAPPRLELTVAVVDARDAVALPRSAVVLRRAGSPLHRESFTSGDGILALDFRPHADLVTVARAVGFRERALSSADVAAAARAGAVLPVPLEPGCELSLLVWSLVEDAPLAGATLLGDGLPLATSDAAGRLHLSGPRWPASIRVEAPGHAPRELTARELVMEAALELERP